MYDLSWLNPTPHAIAVYASRPLSPVAAQHSLPSGRYPLLGPDFHRLDRTSLRLAHSFDHLVGAKQNRGWYRNAYRLCGLEVHDELEIRWQLNRQICRFTPPKHLGSDAAYAAVDVKNVRPIRHQPSISRKLG